MLPQGSTRWSIPLSARKANATLEQALTRSFVAGEQSVAAIEERCGRLLGRRWRWVGPLAARYLRVFAGRSRPRQREVVRFLVADERFARARVRHAKTLRVVAWVTDAQEMQPVTAASGWNVAPITSQGGLAALC